MDSHPEQAGADLPDLLAIPFFWDSDRLKLRERYRIDLLVEARGCFALRFQPIRSDWNRSLDQAVVVLDQMTYLPVQYRVRSDRWDESITYRVTDSRVDRPIPEDAWKVHNESGCKTGQLWHPALLRWIARAQQNRPSPKPVTEVAPQPGP